ncbi:ABC-three component system middle component 6 [Vibrio parahaemolyticus]|uniref:ABC-three component system middle component 6 n=1 Tax=Vibrio parahaemolyticus TaxID=670 RepID=UPI002B21FB70|nr:ABC-three component system middle component 6 [Vibrio parahaemolyticus]MEA5369438.1 ABC-three component system middle component 6 [Vibrio parahaemolyticus]
MIPRSGCDPEINVVSIGAKILKKVVEENPSLDAILIDCSSELKVSIDHIILSLDWLFSIKAIGVSGTEVFINEA